jgi:hypothetical protein
MIARIIVVVLLLAAAGLVFYINDRAGVHDSIILAMVQAS